MRQTTRVRYGSIHELRNPAKLCFACMQDLHPDDVVELVMPASDTLTTRLVTVMWHANEACATNNWVIDWIRLDGRNPED